MKEMFIHETNTKGERCRCVANGEAHMPQLQQPGGSLLAVLGNLLPVTG